MLDMRFGKIVLALVLENRKEGKYKSKGDQLRVWTKMKVESESF